MARVYVSYSTKDSALAQQVATQLRARGHQIEIFIDSLVPGVEWRRELMDKLLLSDGVVVLLSEDALKSPFVCSEIGSARALSGRFLIPVILDDCPLHALIQDIYVIPLKSRSPASVRKVVVQIDQAVKTHLQRSAALLGVRVPAGYDHLTSHVRRFCDESAFERNVFVMMKFPGETHMPARHIRLLNDVWEVISTRAARHGLEAKRADKGTYHDQLWENICVHIIGSKYGIAILEDVVASELNPNVALEYGFMKALDHPVALMRSSGFKHSRADFSGKLAKTFDIVSGTLRRASLRQAVDGWFKELGLSVRRRTRRDAMPSRLRP